MKIFFCINKGDLLVITYHKVLTSQTYYYNVGYELWIGIYNIKRT